MYFYDYTINPLLLSSMSLLYQTILYRNFNYFCQLQRKQVVFSRFSAKVFNNFNLVFIFVLVVIADVFFFVGFYVVDLVFFVHRLTVYVLDYYGYFGIIVLTVQNQNDQIGTVTLSFFSYF